MRLWLRFRSWLHADPQIDGWIRSNAAWTSSRRKWLVFDSQLQAAALKRQNEKDTKTFARAGRAASPPADVLPRPRFGVIRHGR